MDNQKLLISIYQNTSTAIQSINDLLPKNEDERSDIAVPAPVVLQLCLLMTQSWKQTRCPWGC